jgi:hypothetical protein
MALTPTPPYSSPRVPPSAGSRDDWEDWEEEDVCTPMSEHEPEPLLAAAPRQPASTHGHTKPVASRHSQPRYSVHKIKRLKSRQRQKAQNAKAGISLVTDMTAFRRGHAGNQMRSPQKKHAKFVDAAALKALEGEPSSASVGNWNWLKRKASKHQQGGLSPQSATRSPLGQDLSPSDRPIVIGIALPPDVAADREISPQTATVETPIDLPRFLAHTPPPPVPKLAAAKPASTISPLTPSQHKSVWSPDTPDTTSPFGSMHRSSSVYSQYTTASGKAGGGYVPPVPAVPGGYGASSSHVLTIQLRDKKEDIDDDAGSTHTLFEEDDYPTTSPFKPSKTKQVSKSPDTATTQSTSWWDSVITPEAEQRNPLSPGPYHKQAGQTVIKASTGNTWKSDEQTKSSYSKVSSISSYSASPNLSPVINNHAPVVRVPSPRRTPSPRMDQKNPQEYSPSPAAVNRQPETPRNKDGMIIVERGSTTPDYPPPYSPPKNDAPVRYRPVFPPGHPLTAQYPPSPGPMTPGIAGTMTSQGAINMTDIPLTPSTTAPSVGQSRLPQRPIGTYLPQEHSLASNGPGSRVERERRRHEKEEVAARKMGSFWRGRFCIPLGGCYGRTGREGRKRRRVWLGVIAGIIAALILIIVLAVTLSARGGPAAPVDNLWVNLTNFPPMPTGVLTVVGPDNSVAASGCTQPTTLWSCALPKDQHASVGPFNPNQPTFILHTQWDNGTAEAWNVPNGQRRRRSETVERRWTSGYASKAASLIRGRAAKPIGASPNPRSPKFAEMFFLGDTTDGIVSPEKGGEPTPFYISLIKSENDTAGPNALARRQSSNNSLSIPFPKPDLNPDGTGAPARLFPHAFQQPVRLFDRGLPTEHYGFYTYFKRTLYLRSVKVLNDSDPNRNVPLDEDGGSRQSEARFLVTWTETRFLVQIWTRAENTTKLLTRADGLNINGSSTLARPGTMPYPITFKMDTHGGNPKEKFVFQYGVDDRQRIDTSSPKLFANNIGVGGSWVNPRGSDRDDTLGGVDGGTGGCRCEWVNFIQRRPSSPTSP